MTHRSRDVSPAQWVIYERLVDSSARVYLSACHRISLLPFVFTEQLRVSVLKYFFFLNFVAISIDIFSCYYSHWPIRCSIFLAYHHHISGHIPRTVK
jgi:hypothetical protein